MGQGDRNLLERWVDHRDADAFRQIGEQYAGMMYATCLRVLKDAQEAEDVAQDCLEFLVQTEEVPDSPFLGPWLHSIATRKALMRLRSNARRRNREHHYAETTAHETDPGWNDLGEHVDEAIAELPDDLREPLLAHYFQGQSHRAIAGALNIPRRTVSNRIVRGVQLVGAALKNRGVTVSATALGALLHANLAEAAALPYALTVFIEKSIAAHGGQTLAHAAAAGGVRAMLIKLSIGAAIIGGAAGLWWTIQDGGERPTSARAIAAEATNEPEFLVAAAGIGRETSLQDETAPSNSNEVPNGDALVIVQVVDRGVNPRQGAQVTLWLYRNPDPNESTDEPSTMTGVTDEKGEVNFDRVAQENFAVTARIDDAVGFGWVDRSIYSRERIVLRFSANTTVRVTDTQGRPVSGAQLYHLQTRPKDQRKYGPGNRVMVGTTGADGSVQLAIPNGQTWRIQFFSNRHASKIVEDIAGGADYKVDVSEGSTLAGVLRPKTPDVNVDGVVISAQSTEYELERRTAVTDESGRFTIANLAAGDYAITSESETVALREGEVIINAQTYGGEIELNGVAGAVLAGIVRTDSDRLSIEGAKITASRLVGDRRPSQSTTSDADGRYRLAGLSPGTYDVRLYDNRRNVISPAYPKEEVTLRTGETREDVHFTLPSNPAVTATVGGRVTHKGAPVSAFVTAYPRAGFYGSKTIRTDNGGRFLFDELPATRDLRVRAFLPGLASEELTSLVLPPEGLSGLTLALQPTGSVSGRVVGTTGRALDAGTHYVEFLNRYAHGIDLQSSCTVLEDGRFSIPDVPAGEHRLYVEQRYRMGSTGIQIPDATLEIASGEHVDRLLITIDDRRGVTAEGRAKQRADEERMIRESREREKRAWGVKGRVLDARTGDPVTAYFLTAMRMGESRQDVSDEKGRFEVQPKVVKRTIIQIEAPGYQPNKTFLWPVDVVDLYVEAEIRLQPGPIIEGIVQDSQGQPVSGARVFPLELPGDLESQHARFPTTGRDGRFRLDTLEPKPQQLFVERIGYPITKVGVAPVASRTTEVLITLSTGARIEGVVTDDGVPVAGTRVSHYVPWHHSRLPFVQTGADGRYVIKNVATGTVRVGASLANDGSQPDSYRYQTREILVDGDGPYQANFDFKPPTNTIQGSITLNGEVLRWASVNAYMEVDGVRENSNSRSTRAGAYEIEMLPPGKALLTASVRTPNADTILRQQTDVQLGNNESITLDFDFQGNGVVQGVIDNVSPGEYGAVYAIPGTVVPRGPFATAHDLNLTDYYARTQIKDGGYVLEAVPPGPYVIFAASQDQHLFDPAHPRMAWATVTVKSDEPIALDFTF